jgi:hypothetical protein
MAFTARLPAELVEEATAYAARLGISLNALLAVAMRDYLDQRKLQPSSASDAGGSPNASPSAANAASTSKSSGGSAPGSAMRRSDGSSIYDPPRPIVREKNRFPEPPQPAGRSGQCQCGSGKKWKHCHGTPLRA